MFSHEKLQVYAKALDFTAIAAAHTATWDKSHAFIDHLDRAAESVLCNLAETARQTVTAAKLQTVDYAIDSALECAGCLDIAPIKGFLTDTQAYEEKQRLCEITKMLIGLRKAWAESVVREEPVDYSAKSVGRPPERLFHHEGLEAYQAALAFMEWFAAQPGAGELPSRLLRQVDEAGTGVVLNIAEGNGRYAKLDHHRFVQMAQTAAVKAAVSLDLSAKREVWPSAETDVGKGKLRRISVLLGGF